MISQSRRHDDVPDAKSPSFFMRLHLCPVSWQAITWGTAPGGPHEEDNTGIAVPEPGQQVKQFKTRVLMLINDQLGVLLLLNVALLYFVLSIKRRGLEL